VHQARAEARAGAEAAAEQRLAALDQARREEREAAVRAALALGARRVGAHPHAIPLWHASLYISSTHSATDMPPIRYRARPPDVPAVSWLGSACCRLLTRAQPAMDMADLRVFPVTAEDNASRHGADTACSAFAGVQH